MPRKRPRQASHRRPTLAAPLHGSSCLANPFYHRCEPDRTHKGSTPATRHAAQEHHVFTRRRRRRGGGQLRKGGDCAEAGNGAKGGGRNGGWESANFPKRQSSLFTSRLPSNIILTLPYPQLSLKTPKTGTLNSIASTASNEESDTLTPLSSRSSTMRKAPQISPQIRHSKDESTALVEQVPKPRDKEDKEEGRKPVGNMLESYNCATLEYKISMIHIRFSCAGIQSK